MKHNGLANLFLGIIYGCAITLAILIDLLEREILITVVVLAGIFFLTAFLYDMYKE